MENAEPAPVELPRDEQLVRLYELRDKIEAHISKRGVLNPRSEMERHFYTHGHRLRYGCCRRNPLEPAAGG